MRVVFHDVLDRQPLGNARPVGSLDILLRESDFVTLHVPGGSGTYRLIGRKELRSVKVGSFLVNTSRGSVIDEKALDEALTRGRLGGVALDVLDIEPSSPHARLRNELLRHPCVLVTPHMGGNTVEAQERIARSVATKMVRFINEGATVGAVNFPQVDLPRTPETHRVMHIHKNVPGVLSSVNGILSRLGANVESQFLKTNELVGYLVVDIDRNVSADVLKALTELPETLRARRLF
jgi:D-3-phosphoglycerate dehydrogenase